MNNLTKLDLSKNTQLIKLYCADNSLTSLNVTGLTSLKTLDCYMNLIPKLDLTSNINLQKLSASDNKLTQLDVSKNVNLTDIDVNRNQLVTLDLSKSPNLKYVQVQSNKLTALSVANGNNAAITTMKAGSNSGLTCVQIDKGFTPPSGFGSGWYVDSTSSYYYSTCAKLSTTNFNKQPITLLNPVKENLIIKGDAKVEKVEIYSATGQLVKVLVNNNTNVSSLAKGIYLVKITTNNGVVTEKIIKE